jgi:hypothetical protein
MSRSGYSEDLDEWALIRYRGQVASATRGKRGQALLRETLAALDAMPVKVLISHELIAIADGAFCTLGVVGKQRGVDLTALDPEDIERVAQQFDIAACLAREIVYENDEGGDYKELPHQRWVRMRQWVAQQIKETT